MRTKEAGLPGDDGSSGQGIDGTNGSSPHQGIGGDNPNTPAIDATGSNYDGSDSNMIGETDQELIGQPGELGEEVVDAVTPDNAVIVHGDGEEVVEDQENLDEQRQARDAIEEIEDGIEEQNDNEEEQQEEEQQEEEQQTKKPGVFKRVKNAVLENDTVKAVLGNKSVQAVRDRYGKSNLQKYGTNSVKELAKKRAWKATKAVGKFAGRTAKRTIRAGVTLAGGTIGAVGGAVVGSMIGKGTKLGTMGAAAGGALGNKISSKIENRADRIASKAGSYIGTAYNAAVGKNPNKEKFMSNENNIDRARRNFKEREKRKGTGREIEKELDNMYYMKEHGVQDSLLEDTMNQYYDNIKPIEEEGNGMSDTIGRNTAIQAALMAQEYSKKDMSDPKKMEEAYQELSRRYEAAGISRDIADGHIGNIMKSAGSMNGANIALPSHLAGTNRTIDIQTNNRQAIPDVSEALSIDTSTADAAQIERMNNVTIRLHRAGFDRTQISQIASTCAGGTTTEILDKYEARVEYLDDGTAQEEARRTIESTNGGNNATARQVRDEMKERLIIKSTFNVESEKDISALRDLEKTEVRGKTQIQAAREFAQEHRGKLKNEAHMATARENLERKLVAGGSSADKAKKDAGNIINLAGQYTNEV